MSSSVSDQGKYRAFRATQARLAIGPKHPADDPRIALVPAISMLSLQQAHANSDLDRNPHRLDHRRADPVALGRRSFVLFGAAAERRRRVCRAVGRIQDVDLTKKATGANGGGQARLWRIASAESRHATALNVINVSKRLSQASH